MTTGDNAREKLTSPCTTLKAFGYGDNERQPGSASAVHVKPPGYKRVRSYILYTYASSAQIRNIWPTQLHIHFVKDIFRDPNTNPDVREPHLSHINLKALLHAAIPQSTGPSPGCSHTLTVQVISHSYQPPPHLTPSPCPEQIKCPLDFSPHALARDSAAL